MDLFPLALEARMGHPGPTHFEQLTARVNSCPDTRLDPAIQTDYETALVILTQVHAVVETRDLVGIAVEHEGLALQKFAQAALRGLAPTGMIHRRIHIGVETIFVWSFFVPTRRRLAIH